MNLCDICGDNGEIASLSEPAKETLRQAFAEVAVRGFARGQADAIPRAKVRELIVQGILEVWSQAVKVGYEPGLSTWVHMATTKAEAIADKLLAEESRLLADHAEQTEKAPQGERREG